MASKLAPAENVRAALLLVSRGEAPLGIVYRTDALADRNVMTFDTFPEATHAPIAYPAALTVGAGMAISRTTRSASTGTAVTKAIPSSGQKVPVIGIGTPGARVA